MRKIIAILILMNFISCCSCPNVESNQFPRHWWRSDPKQAKAFWEILPESARNGEVILSKRNELGILSNFSLTPFTYHGKRYQSLEGFWAMMLYPENKQDPRFNPKVIWKFTRDQVSQMVAFDAKKASELAEQNMKILKIEWASFEGERFPYRSNRPGRHYQLIWDASIAKVQQNEKVKEVLLSTKNLILRPDHLQEENPPPEWKYYEIYMKIRQELQSKGNLDLI